MVAEFADIAALDRQLPRQPTLNTLHQHGRAKPEGVGDGAELQHVKAALQALDL